MELEITRGDTPEWPYKLYDDAMQPLALQDVTVWFTAKPAIDDDATDAAAVLKHYIVFDNLGAVTSAAGFRLGGIDPDETSPTFGQELTSFLDGVITHAVPVADSTALAPGEYVYDMQVQLPDGRVKTIIRNAPLTVVGDITRRITTP